MVLSRSDLDSIKAMFMEDSFLDTLAEKVATLLENKFTDKLKEQQETINALRTEINDLKVQNQRCKQTLDDYEQSSRSLNIRVFGMPKTEKEDLRSKMIDLFRKIEVPVVDQQITSVHRVAPKVPNDRPPAILVKFANDAARLSVLKHKKKLKSTNIQIKEDLTQSRRALLAAAVQKFSFKMVWCYNGVVCVKIGNVINYVKTMDELNQL